MSLSRRVRVLIFLISANLTLEAQSQFADKTDEYQINHVYGIGTAGGGVSLADFNGDGWDDLTLASGQGKGIHFYKNNNGKLEKIDLLPNYNLETKSVLWVDFDNDGDQDLFLAVADHYNYLFKNLGNLVLEDVTFEVGLPTDDDFTTFGACWGDFNRDGWLDLYYGERRVQSGAGPNQCRLWLNHLGKSFIDVTENSGTKDDNGKTQFCSSFVDVNNDRWPDIYTAQDRNRGNTLLVNNQDGSFSDLGAEKQCNLEMDGMSVSVGDYNNDGWQDIYVSNTEAGNALFVNNQGETLPNLAVEKGVGYYGVAWGTNFLDGDNDGDQDLYVCGMLIGSDVISSRYFTNMIEEDTFVLFDQIPSDTVSSFNSASGDINNDGYADLAVINLGPYPSFIFENSSGNNHYIKIKLNGVKSNKDGIGCLITTHTGAITQYKYTQCGIGFLGQNSNTQIVGINNNEIVDSITILWPTGHIDTYYDLQGDTIYVLTEGESTGGNIMIDADVEILSNTNETQLNREDFTISPNPSSDGNFYITYPQNQCIANIEIYDIKGQMIKSEYHGEDRISIGGENKNQFYFCTVTDCNGKVFTQKILLTR